MNIRQSKYTPLSDSLVSASSKVVTLPTSFLLKGQKGRRGERERQERKKGEEETERKNKDENTTRRPKGSRGSEQSG
jgi:hypothetical protein